METDKSFLERGMNHQTYTTNYIVEVILRVDFKIRQKISSDIFNAFRENLKIDNIEFKEQDVTGYTFQLAKGNQEIRIQDIGKRGIFEIPNDNAKFIFDHESFLLTTNRYERFSSFFELFKTGFDLMCQITSQEEFRRIGLRFINIINLENIPQEINWHEYINDKYMPDYLYFNNVFPGIDLRRNINTFVLKINDYYINLILGLYNDNFPGKIIDKKFVVDIDCYIDNVSLDKDDILKRPPEMDILTYQLFENIITDKLKKIMEGGQE